MGLVNRVKSIFLDKAKQRLYWNILNDKTTIFTDFGDDVYLSDFVNNCIDRIATEISKIEIVSVVNKPNTIQQQNDDITRLFRFKPNPLQTTKDFLSCCEWLRRKDYNCFIYPQYKEVIGSDGIKYKKYTAFYPLNPIKVEFGINDGHIWEIRMYFDNNYTVELPYSEIIHLKWRRGKNTISGGGNDQGNPDTTDLLKSVKILDQVLQGLPKSIEAGLKIKGVYSAKSLLDNDKLKAARDDLESHIFTSKSGILATDLGGEFTPINYSPTRIEPDVLKFLKDILRERYGISADILSGDYDGEKHSAFYQTCIEDFIIEFEQAASSTLFSVREQDVGHRVKCYYNKIAYLTTSNKIEIAKLSTDTGLMKLNEINEMFGIPPFDGGDRRLQSLNYVNVDLVDKYQMGKAGSKKNEKE